MATWPPFLTRCHPLTPILWLALTQWPPFSITNNQFPTIAHRMTSFSVDNISSKFLIFFKIFVNKVSKFVFCVENWQKICLILTIRPPFYGLLSEWSPFFLRKNLSLKDLSFELLSEHPCHFQSWGPPPRYCDNIWPCNIITDGHFIILGILLFIQ